MQRTAIATKWVKMPRFNKTTLYKLCPYKMPSCFWKTLKNHEKPFIEAHTFLTKCLCCFSNPRFGPYEYYVATKCPFDFDRSFWSSPDLLTKCHCDSYDSLTCLTRFPHPIGFGFTSAKRYKILDLDSMSLFSPTKMEASVGITRPNGGTRSSTRWSWTPGLSTKAVAEKTYRFKTCFATDLVFFHKFTVANWRKFEDHN